MPTPTVRISTTSHRLLAVLAQRTGQSRLDVLDQALETYRRKVFFEKLNAGYAQLRRDAKAWREELAERDEWDAVLQDGLNPDEHWSEKTRQPARRKTKKS